MLEISKTDVLKSLRRDNPWWDEAYSAPQIVAEKKRAYFEPFAALALDWSIRRSTILMGPRRVGKTVMLRQLIEKAISEGFAGQKVLLPSRIRG